MSKTWQIGTGLVFLVVCALICATLIAPILGAKGPEPTASTSAWTAAATPPLASPSAVPEASPAASPVTINEATLREARVNELGVVPVLMYHGFTSDPAQVDEWTRHIDDFRNDLQWLYDHNFYVISMRNLIENDIAAPIAKHPVVLTFDDALPSQFQFMEDATGELVPAPDSGVGVLEAFFAQHPDFGKAGHFAIVPTICFAVKDKPFNTLHDYCGTKLQWLAEHGYEVGNHTWDHANLSQVSGEEVSAQVGQTAEFIDKYVTGPGNMSTLLTLPYGDAPAAGTDGASYLANGVWWNNQEWIIQGIVRVSGGPVYSPASSWWNPAKITRFNTDQSSLNLWFGQFERGEMPLYTSDGDPVTVSIPDPLPEYFQNELDPDLLASSGKSLVEYSPSNPHALGPGVEAYTLTDGIRLRLEPSTAGPVVLELDERLAVTIVAGPVAADGYTWWQVRLDDGTEGWVVGEFLDMESR